MKTSDIVNACLSSIAIIISLTVWRTTDTRASEMREKVIKYSVDQHESFTTMADDSESFAREWQDDSKSKTISEQYDFRVTVSNVGTLPTKDVTITISTNFVSGKLPPYTVELNHPFDRDVVVQDGSLVIRFKHPLGPKSSIEADVTFETIRDHKVLAKGFELKQAFVDSEMGAATLVASVSENGTSSGRDAKF